MDNLTVKVLKRSLIEELSCPAMSGFKGRQIIETPQRHWNRGVVSCHDVQCMFIGKTGYGKSSTLNRVIGVDIFKTDEIRACTANLYSADYRLHDSRHHYLSLCDLPGVGESETNDANYFYWYEQMVKKSDCIVYVLRADQRDMSVDLKVFMKLKLEPANCIIALNFCDKIEPFSRHAKSPTDAQLDNINQKINVVRDHFRFPGNQIVPYSAGTGWNVKELTSAMAAKLKAGFMA